MRPLLIGNWKMNKTSREAVDFIERLAPQLEGMRAAVWVAVPFTSIHPAALVAKGTPISIGAQNIHEARDGAFTGEISALMLKEAGATFTLVGHAERRHLFGESDARIRDKVHRALSDDLAVVLCVGEQKHEKAHDVLKRQLESAIKGIPHESLVIAYEPVWAIGSGETPQLEQIAETHAYIRKLVGKKTPILYGGSVKPETAHALLRLENVNGLLVGGASLEPSTFHSIIQAAE